MSGIVLSLLVIIALVVVGTVVGAILWKLQPWEDRASTSKADDGEFTQNHADLHKAGRT